MIEATFSFFLDISSVPFSPGPVVSFSLSFCQRQSILLEDVDGLSIVSYTCGFAIILPSSIGLRLCYIS